MGRGRWFRAALGVVVASTLALNGCGSFFVPPDNSGGGDNGGGGGGGTGGAGRVYVGNASTGTISGYNITNGNLTQVPNSPVKLGYSPLAMVVSPNNSRLYVAGTGVINVFAINSDGSLTGVNGTVVASVGALDISPDGGWLFGLDLLSKTLDPFQIDPNTGALSPGSPVGYVSTIAGIPTPQGVKVTSNGYVVVSLGNDGDSVFSYNAASTPSAGLNHLQHLTLPSTQTSDNGIAVDSTGTNLYIARSGTNGGIAVYTIGSGGVLNPISGSPFAAGSRPFALTLDETGKYLYAANYQDGNISGYTIGTSPALTPIAGSPFSSGSQVNSLGVDSSGTYLLAGAQQGNPDLSMYSFDATTPGKLNLAKSIATDTDPAGVSVIALTH
jgi:6-phosphogluconolactonase